MKQLLQLLAKEDTVIFVGSGVSRWAGLPSWEGVIERLALYIEEHGGDPTLVRQEAASGDLLQAASYGIAKLTKRQFGEVVRLACRTGEVEPMPIHEALMNLGPSCFITTNYDDLLEQAFRRWRVGQHEPQIVLNRQPAEQADVIQTTARNFVFKPHGDARDVETIVLTREQYRSLMPEGDFSATLTTLKMLLATRPMLFVGFGLRDPDFLQVRDLLANIYRGGTRDHYAIVADPMREQIDWWRDNYGVHLIGYQTRALMDGHGRDHSGLVELLLAVGVPSKPTPTVAYPLDVTDPALVLKLARYAESNMAHKTATRFDISVSPAKDRHRRSMFESIDPYSTWSIERLLLEGPRRLVLTGAPGAGKSFAMRHAVKTFATRLQGACLQDDLSAQVQIAILVDLKLYDGDLRVQIDRLLPPTIDLARLNQTFTVMLFLDGFNELPREHRESGRFDVDFDALLLAHPGMDIVIGSRTSDGLTRFEFPIYELSDIPRDDVKGLLFARGCVIPETHREEIETILGRPFYFRMFEQSAISLDDVHTPADLYAQYVGNLNQRYIDCFGNDFNLVSVLEQLAYRALEGGAEAFMLDDLRDGVRAVAPATNTVSPDEFVNWLVTAEVVIALGGRRGAFVHQSITEYLAACELARRLAIDDLPVNDLIVLRRWDNVIFLALSMLNSSTTRTLLNQIIDVDIDFAIHAARFAEGNRDSLLDCLLNALLTQNNPVFPDRFSADLTSLPFTECHVALLRRLPAKLPQLGGDVAQILARLLGQEYKPELIETLFGAESGWEVRGAMGALASLLKNDDVVPLIDRALEWDVASLDDDEGETTHRISALANALNRRSVEEIEVDIFSRVGDVDLPQKRLLAALIAELAINTKFAGAVRMLSALTKSRFLKNTFALYLAVEYEQEERAWFVGHFDEALLEAILDYIKRGDSWAISLLQTACATSSHVAALVAEAAQTHSGHRRQILDFCATGSNKAIFLLLEALATTPRGSPLPLDFRAIDYGELDWAGRHDLMLALLQRQDNELASCLLGHSIPITIKGLESIALGDAMPWLNWMIDLLNNDDQEGSMWLAHQIAFLIGRSSSPNSKAQLLALLISDDVRMREAIGHMVMQYVEELAMDELGSEATAVLLQLLHTKRYDTFNCHCFAYIADERFVREQLLPLAFGNQRIRSNIAAITQVAGGRLGMRFVLPSIDKSPLHA